MKPLLITSSDAGIGAYRATMRLHKAMLAHGVESHMRVGMKETDMISVEGAQRVLGKFIWEIVRPGFANRFMRLQKTTNPVLHSPALLPSLMIEKLNASDAELFNIHAIGGEMLSVEDIGRLRKPIVWTLHDMWAFSGAEHYSSDDITARWRGGYTAENRPEGHGWLDIDRWVWQRKKKALRFRMQIVTPSHWLADCVKASALLCEQPVTIIPNLLDTRQFQPWPKSLVRDILGLPPEKHIVLFGAIGGGVDTRKGWDLLQPALAQIANELPNVVGVIFGQSEPITPPRLGMPLRWMGHLNDDATLALFYSAADVMVVPSRQESFGQTASEAQACGCPVVAFNCTGLIDLVAHQETGYLATPYKSEDLANGIRWVLENPERHLRLSSNARERALRLWAQEVVVPQYLAVYKQAIDSAITQ